MWQGQGRGAKRVPGMGCSLERSWSLRREEEVGGLGPDAPGREAPLSGPPHRVEEIGACLCLGQVCVPLWTCVSVRERERENGGEGEGELECA